MLMSNIQPIPSVIGSIVIGSIIALVGACSETADTSKTHKRHEGQEFLPSSSAEEATQSGASRGSGQVPQPATNPNPEIVETSQDHAIERTDASSPVRARGTDAQSNTSVQSKQVNSPIVPEAAIPPTSVGGAYLTGLNCSSKNYQVGWQSLALYDCALIDPKTSEAVDLNALESLKIKSTRVVESENKDISFVPSQFDQKAITILSSSLDVAAVNITAAFVDIDGGDRSFTTVPQLQKPNKYILRPGFRIHVGNDSDSKHYSQCNFGLFDRKDQEKTTITFNIFEDNTKMHIVFKDVCDVNRTKSSDYENTRFEIWNKASNSRIHKENFPDTDDDTLDLKSQSFTVGKGVWELRLFSGRKDPSTGGDDFFIRDLEFTADNPFHVTEVGDKVVPTPDLLLKQIEGTP